MMQTLLFCCSSGQGKYTMGSAWGLWHDANHQRRCNMKLRRRKSSSHSMRFSRRRWNCSAGDSSGWEGMAGVLWEWFIFGATWRLLLRTSPSLFIRGTCLETDQTGFGTRSGNISRPKRSWYWPANKQTHSHTHMHTLTGRHIHTHTHTHILKN